MSQTVVFKGRIKLRVILPTGNERAIHEKPVYKKNPLQSIDGTARYLEMGVAPSSPPRPLHIAEGYVHATDESHPAVYDAELAMVAIVHLACEGWELHRHKRMHVDSGIAHALVERSSHLPIPHIIVDKAHFHTLTSFIDQRIGYQIAQRVVGKDITKEVYVMLRPPYFFEQGREKLIARGIDFHLVILERQGHILVGIEAHQGLILLRKLQIALLNEL